MRYQVEDGALPPRQAARFPIRKLEVGQSFLVPLAEEKALRRAAANYNRNHREAGMWVSVRLEANGVRCGRLA